MSQRRAGFGLGVISLGVALALAPMSVASAASHKGKTHHQQAKKRPKPKHHQTTATTSASGSFNVSTVCDVLVNKAEGQKIESALAAAENAATFAQGKQELVSLFSTISKEAPAAEATMRSTPANVQAAFKALIGSEAQLNKSIASATSSSQLQADFTSAYQNPTFTADGGTVDSYSTAHCGS
jgi:hypothetical protein